MGDGNLPQGMEVGNPLVPLTVNLGKKVGFRNWENCCPRGRSSVTLRSTDLPMNVEVSSVRQSNEGKQRTSMLVICGYSKGKKERKNWEGQKFFFLNFFFGGRKDAIVSPPHIFLYAFPSSAVLLS